MKKISAYEVALSAIACAISTVALTVGTLYPPALFTGYLFACLALTLPLAKNCYWGAVLAYIGGGMLAMLFNGFNFIDTMPYFLFFGLHPIVNGLQIRLKVNRVAATAVKAVWFDGAMYLLWRFVFAMTTAIPFVDKYIIPIILVVGTLFFIVYDMALFETQRRVNVFVAKYIKK